MSGRRVGGQTCLVPARRRGGYWGGAGPLIKDHKCPERAKRLKGTLCVLA